MFSIEFDVIIYQSIAHETLNQTSSGSNVIRVTVEPQIIRNAATRFVIRVVSCTMMNQVIND